MSGTAFSGRAPAGSPGSTPVPLVSHLPRFPSEEINPALDLGSEARGCGENEQAASVAVLTNCCVFFLSEYLAAQVKQCAAGILAHHPLSGSAGSAGPALQMFRAKL